MSGINKVILVGRLGAKPESKETANGLGARFSLATSESYTSKATNQKVEKTEWHSVVVWGKLAEIVIQYLDKGSMVYLEGKLETQKYQDKTGQDRHITKVVLNGFNSKLEMLDRKPSSDQRVPVPQPGRSPQVDNSHLTDRGGDGQPVAKDEFDDDVPF
jgi:single-strand DNA-binding protein